MSLFKYVVFDQPDMRITVKYGVAVEQHIDEPSVKEITLGIETLNFFLAKYSTTVKYAD